MTDENGALVMEGVRFFGEMSASVSHEIKNVLAIINENAGLLQDLVRMKTKGTSLNTDRLLQLADSIHRQVDRGDRIVKDMNRFSHSADNFTETVDVGELVQFILQLGQRLITLKGNMPAVEAPNQPVTVTANRFLLENLVWSCLRRSMNACDSDQQITIFVDSIDAAARIRFFGMNEDRRYDAENFYSYAERNFARFLGTKVTLEENEGQIQIHIFNTTKV